VRYYKRIDNDYISQIGTDCGGAEITETEYIDIMGVIRAKPTAPNGYGYCLKTDLTWELVELPPEPEAVEDKAEAFDILMGEVE